MACRHRRIVVIGATGSGKSMLATGSPARSTWPSWSSTRETIRFREPRGAMAPIQ